MFLTNHDMVELQAFRHDLHRHPEVSGEERETARRVVDALRMLGPTTVLTDLGGHGVAAIFAGESPGPTLLFRAELDALPIAERSDAAHRSRVPGKGHLCGHDGHSTILLALARGSRANRWPKDVSSCSGSRPKKTAAAPPPCSPIRAFRRSVPTRPIRSTTCRACLWHRGAEERTCELCLARHEDQPVGQDRACLAARDRNVADGRNCRADARADRLVPTARHPQATLRLRP